MKKILKSILIATASIGTISGSTAAVVSCGSTTPNADKQKNYDEALTSVVNHFSGTSGVDLFSATPTQIGDGSDTGAAGIKPLVQKSVYDFINTYTGNGALTADQKAALNPAANGSNIVVTIQGHLSVDKANHTTDGTNYISITIPAVDGATASPKMLTGVKYLVTTDPADQAAYDQQLSKLIDGLNANDANTPGSLLGTVTLYTGSRDDIDLPIVQSEIQHIISNDDLMNRVLGTVTLTKSTGTIFNTDNEIGTKKLSETIGITVTAKQSQVIAATGKTFKTSYVVQNKDQVLYETAMKQAISLLPPTAVYFFNVTNAGTSDAAKMRDFYSGFNTYLNFVISATPYLSKYLNPVFGGSAAGIIVTATASDFHTSVVNAENQSAKVKIQIKHNLSMNTVQDIDPIEVNVHYRVSADSAEVNYGNQLILFQELLNIMPNSEFPMVIVKKNATTDEDKRYTLDAIKRELDTRLLGLKSIFTQLTSCVIENTEFNTTAFDSATATSTSKQSGTITALILGGAQTSYRTNTITFTVNYIVVDNTSGTLADIKKDAYNAAIQNVIAHFNAPGNNVDFSLGAGTTGKPTIEEQLKFQIQQYIHNDIGLNKVLNNEISGIVITGLVDGSIKTDKANDTATSAPAGIEIQILPNSWLGTMQTSNATAFSFKYTVTGTQASDQDDHNKLMIQKEFMTDVHAKYIEMIRDDTLLDVRLQSAVLNISVQQIFSDMLPASATSGSYQSLLRTIVASYFGLLSPTRLTGQISFDNIQKIPLGSVGIVKVNLNNITYTSTGGSVKPLFSATDIPISIVI